MVSIAGSLLPGVVRVSPFQICARENNVILRTVYCSKFDCLGIIGYVLHKTISKRQAKMVGLSQSCQFAGLLLFNICNTFKLCQSFRNTDKCRVHKICLKNMRFPWEEIHKYIFLSLVLTTPKCQSVCVTFSLIIFFHLS